MRRRPSGGAAGCWCEARLSCLLVAYIEFADFFYCVFIQGKHAAVRPASGPQLPIRSISFDDIEFAPGHGPGPAAAISESALSRRICLLGHFAGGALRPAC